MLAVYPWRGQHYVAGRPGTRYAIRVTNRSGERVLAVGFPFGIGPSASEGVVSGLKREFRDPDGKKMLTWVILPPDFDPNQKYPTLLYCQGGPQDVVSQFWSYRWNFQLMAANGYIIVAPNRRGLPGFGQNWTDQIAGDWVAVATGSVQCSDAGSGNVAPTEAWVVFTLTPKPDGTLAGETTRATVNGCSSVKRTVTFTRTGDGSPSQVPDPATLPPRTTSSASTLHGRYHENIVYTNAGFAPGAPDLQVRTYCLRTGDRCISAFHALDGVVTLVFANGKWTRNEEGTVPCALGGMTNTKITAEYPMPKELTDPIQTLEGRGTNTSTGGECKGGDFTDKFVRTGD